MRLVTHDLHQQPGRLVSLVKFDDRNVPPAKTIGPIERRCRREGGRRPTAASHTGPAKRIDRVDHRLDVPSGHRARHPAGSGCQAKHLDAGIPQGQYDCQGITDPRIRIDDQFLHHADRTHNTRDNHPRWPHTSCASDPV